jgi:LPPG:FO 2-phospho-L-lactate transferase
MPVTLLSGGTGGAKLARGLLDAVEPGGLTVIANTGDDGEFYGAHVSPDPDLVTYWLADLIDERGYGIRGDTWEVMSALEAAGRPVWFRLGDRDLAMCLIRTEMLSAGERLTDAHAAVVQAAGVGAGVLPMSDEPVRTKVTAKGRTLPFQEFMIVTGAEGPIDGVELAGIEAAQPTPEALKAIAEADVIVIGPSNPVASIGPIMSMPGMREAIAGAAAPVVAVSPFLGGGVLKGPTEAFCRHAGIRLGAEGMLDAYPGLIDGPARGCPTLVTDTLMDRAEDRWRVATETLDFAASLARSEPDSA